MTIAKLPPAVNPLYAKTSPSSVRFGSQQPQANEQHLQVEAKTLPLPDHSSIQGQHITLLLPNDAKGSVNLVDLTRHGAPSVEKVIQATLPEALKTEQSLYLLSFKNPAHRQFMTKVVDSLTSRNQLVLADDKVSVGPAYIHFRTPASLDKNIAMAANKLPASKAYFSHLKQAIQPQTVILDLGQTPCPSYPNDIPYKTLADVEKEATQAPDPPLNPLCQSLQSLIMKSQNPLKVKH